MRETSIEGNFIVSGEFRSHEVSINKEAFLYKLPFSVDVTDKIVKESVDLRLPILRMEILGDNLLKVNIEFMVTADEIEEIKEENEMVRRGRKKKKKVKEKEEVRSGDRRNTSNVFRRTTGKRDD